MKRFIEGEDRGQGTLLPELLDDYVAEDNPVRVVDVFVDELDLAHLGFTRVQQAKTGRPTYHPAVPLKLYIYGYLNRIQSSRRLEREAQRNVELMWWTQRLAPDSKPIANFRRDNGKAIRNVCRQFVVLCQQLDLFSDAVVAIDSSKFKAVNSSDGNFTQAKLKRRMEEIEANIGRYLAELDTADRQEAAVKQVRSAGLNDKIAAMKYDARLRHRRLQRANPSRRQAPFERRTRGSQHRQRPRSAVANGKEGSHRNRGRVDDSNR